MKQTIEIEVPDGKKAVWKDNKVVFKDIEQPKPKFDPKSLNAFDRVIVKPDNGEWYCSILSHREDNNIYYRMVDGYGYSRIIPYNDNTKHLIGTTKEAPDFYRYWED